MIEISELRAAISVPANEDEELELLRDEVVDLWERMTGRLWKWREDHVETIRPGTDRMQRLFLELRPVESIVSVETRSDGATTWTESVELSLDGGYELVDGYVLNRFGRSWGQGVRVTYTGGYVATLQDPNENPVQTRTPADVRRALILQAQFLRTRTSVEKIAVKSHAFEHGSTTFETADLHPYFERLARAHVRKIYG